MLHYGNNLHINFKEISFCLSTRYSSIAQISFFASSLSLISGQVLVDMTILAFVLHDKVDQDTRKPFVHIQLRPIFIGRADGVL